MEGCGGVWEGVGYHVQALKAETTGFTMVACVPVFALPGLACWARERERWGCGKRVDGKVV